MIVTCPHCSTRNRVPAKHLASAVRCGSCKAALAPIAEPLNVDAPTFQDIVGAVRVPVLVDFWAAWCGPCRAAAPEVAALARELAGRALVLKVDTEAHPELAARFNVQAIPNFTVLINGRTALQHAGLASRAVMKSWVDKAAGAAT